MDVTSAKGSREENEKTGRNRCGVPLFTEDTPVGRWVGLLEAVLKIFEKLGGG